MGACRDIGLGDWAGMDLGLGGLGVGVGNNC